MSKKLLDHFQSKKLSIDERIIAGKKIREKFPRIKQGDYKPAENRLDPVLILEEQSKTRLPDLVPVRYARMLGSPFAFLRGGAAISRYITALKGKGIDLVYNPNTNLFEATKSFGLLFSYYHKWRSDITSAFTLGMVGINNKDFEPADAFSQSWYYSGNVFWNALMGVRLGLEIAQGRRINNDDSFGRATRISFIFYADF